LECAEGGPHGFASLDCVTSDMSEALREAEMIMVVVPSSAHGDIAKTAAPHLRDGQIVVLHPGRTCGAIEFDNVLRDNHCAVDVTIAEAETFIYASRSDGPARRVSSASKRLFPWQPCRQCAPNGFWKNQPGVSSVHRWSERTEHRLE